jgi:hypothetical protein
VYERTEPKFLTPVVGRLAFFANDIEAAGEYRQSP